MKLPLILGLTIFLAGCGFILPAYWDPGDDPRGRHLKAEAEIIVSALNSFHNDTGHWPNSLTELTPRFAASLPTDIRLGYDAHRNEINFGYEMPFPDRYAAECSTSISNLKWRCMGFV